MGVDWFKFDLAVSLNFILALPHKKFGNTENSRNLVKSLRTLIHRCCVRFLAVRKYRPDMTHHNHEKKRCFVFYVSDLQVIPSCSYAIHSDAHKNKRETTLSPQILIHGLWMHILQADKHFDCMDFTADLTAN